MMIYSTMKEPLPKDHPFIFIQLPSLGIYSVLRSPPPPSRSPNRTCISVKCQSPSFLVGALLLFPFSSAITIRLDRDEKERERLSKLQWRFPYSSAFSWTAMPPTMLTIHRSICTPNQPPYLGSAPWWAYHKSAAEGTICR